jgi:phosphoserine phosphatase
MLRQCALELRGADGLVVAIGDGANDLPMLARRTCRSPITRSPRCASQATHAIDSLRAGRRAQFVQLKP